MPPAVAAGTRAIARKLCTKMNGPVIGGMCPQTNLAFSLEEAPTFGRDSSLTPAVIGKGVKKQSSLSQNRELKMVIEIDPRLDLCYKLAEKDRDKFSPQYRESLDRVFLRLIDMCEKSRDLAIEDLKAECKHIAENIEAVEGTEFMSG